MKPKPRPRFARALPLSCAEYELLAAQIDSWSATMDGAAASADELAKRAPGQAYEWVSTRDTLALKARILRGIYRRMVKPRRRKRR